LQKATAIPQYPTKEPMAVAVVRLLGGNHAEDTRGGTPRASIPVAMQRNWPKVIKIALLVLSSNGID